MGDYIPNILGASNVTGVSYVDANSQLFLPQTEEATTNTNLLESNGDGDTTIFSKAVAGYNLLRDGVNSRLEKYFSSGETEPMQNKILEFAQNIDEKGIPDKIHDGIAKFREMFLTSGIVGKVVGTALNIVYKVGSAIPYVGPIVSALSSTLRASDVESVINATLTHIETDFFDAIENNEDYKNLRKEILEAVSCENITRVTSHMMAAGLEAGIAATEEGSSLAGVTKAIRQRIDKYKEDKENKVIEPLSDAKEYILPTLGTVAGSAFNTTINSATDPTVTTMGTSVINGIPGVVSATASSASNLASAATSLMGSLGGSLGSITSAAGSVGSVVSSLSSVTGALGSIKLPGV